MHKLLVITSLLILFIFNSPQNAALAQDECMSIQNDNQRLACFDLAFGIKKSTSIPNAAQSKWHETIEISKLTDETNIYLTLMSDNELRGRFTKAGPARLILRCQENTTAALIVLNDIYLADIQGYGRVEYRLDKEKMSVVNMTASTDNYALGLWSGNRSIPFIKELLGHNRLIIRATPFNKSPITASFEIKELDTAIKKLRETCNW